MNSSYKNDINYGDILSTITFLTNPKKIIEIGLLEGYSSMKFVENSSSDTEIIGYDIFEKFNGNNANKNNLDLLFKKYNNVNIFEGNFYDLHNNIENESIDILHIDIANNGDIYEFVFKNYISKIKSNGILILEGGSNERDNIEWMKKYNKPKINPILIKYNDSYNIKTIGKIPSLTIIKKK